MPVVPLCVPLEAAPPHLAFPTTHPSEMTLFHWTHNQLILDPWGIILIIFGAGRATVTYIKER